MQSTFWADDLFWPKTRWQVGDVIVFSGGLLQMKVYILDCTALHYLVSLRFLVLDQLLEYVQGFRYGDDIVTRWGWHACHWAGMVLFFSWLLNDDELSSWTLLPVYWSIQNFQKCFESIGTMMGPKTPQSLPGKFIFHKTFLNPRGYSCKCPLPSLWLTPRRTVGRNSLTPSCVVLAVGRKVLAESCPDDVITSKGCGSQTDPNK